jgi:hypothetical protein
VQRWAERTDWDTVCRRAGGRRGYNARRRFLALYRRRRLLDLALKHDLSLFDHGAQAELARRLGVHRSTVHRDLRALAEQARASWRCPYCGGTVLPD